MAEEGGEEAIATTDDSIGVFDVEVGEGVEETELQVDGNGVEEVEEIEEEEAVVGPPPQPQAKKRRTQPGKVATKAKKKKAALDIVAAIPLVSRTGRVVQPSRLHGTIVANRYSTMSSSCSITDTLNRYNNEL